MNQKRLRDMTWEDYGISRYRYRELKAFCLQYPEKKEKLEYGLKAAGDQMVCSGRIGRPTESRAVKNSRLSKDCMMIEEAAKAAAPDLFPWIIASVTEDMNYLSSSGYGTLGLDYNDGFIEMSETDESGNLVKQAHYDLRYHGTGKKAETEIRDVVADIMAYAAERGKDVVIEDLDFKRTKAKQSASTKRKGKRYNRMLHVFDYRRYKETLKNTGFNHRINVVMINPCYTSRIGKRKYCGSKKLNVHQAASYVIARRGQGFIDKLSV